MSTDNIQSSSQRADLEQALRENEVLVAISRVITSSPETGEVYEEFARQARRVLRFDRVAIVLPDEGGETVSTAYAAGMDLPMPQHRPMKGSAFEALVKTQATVLLQESEVRERFPHAAVGEGAGLVSSMLVPLRTRNEMIGALVFRSRVANAYSRTDVMVAERVAAQIAGAIYNAQLYAKQRQTEEALRQARDQLAAVLNAAGDGITVQDRSGRLVYANEAAARMSGYATVQELLEAPLTDVLAKWEMTDEDGAPFPPDQFPARMALNGERPDSVTLHARSVEAGEERWTIVRATPVFGGDGAVQFAVSVMTDVTEQMRAQERLRLYGETIAHSTDGIAIIDLQGRYVEQNAAHQEMIGYSNEELKGKTPAIHLDEQDFVAIYQDLARMGRHRGEYTSRAKDGTVRQVDLSAFAVLDDSGKPYCYVGIKRDVTERVLREQLIRELSVPILQVRDRMLLLPVIGVMDQERASLLTSRLLATVRETRARAVVLDVTGVAFVDAFVANVLYQIVKAAGLLGAEVLVTGVSTQVAKALTGLGLDLAALRTQGDLQGGMEEAERMLAGLGV
jgi:anti-anti-sigma factor